jgi:putative transposase
MRTSRFEEAQIVKILGEAGAGQPIDQVCREHGISRETMKRWRVKYGGLEVGEAAKLRVLDDENRRLRRALKELELDNRMLRDLLAREAPSPADRREAARYLRDSYSVSERRACRTIGTDRSSVRYSSQREESKELLDRIRELAAANPRHGYRRQTDRLRAEGFLINAKRVLRLRRLLGLEAKRSARPASSRSTGAPAGGAKWAALRAREGDAWRG